MRWLQRSTGVVAIVSLAATGGCSVTDTDRAPVAAIDVSPDALQLATGGSGALSAQATDVSGNVLDGRRIVWASSNPSVATVSDRGVVTAVNIGRADIAATSEGKTGVATVTVSAQQAVVASVRIAPTTLSLVVAETAQLTASALDSQGAAIQGRPVVWTTNNVGVAAVSQTGQVTGLVPGAAVITAVVDGRSATANVTVRLVPVSRVTVTPSDVTIDAGKSTTLVARVLDAAGNQLSGRAVAWSSSDTRIVTVDQAGVVRGVRRGSAVVTATSEGRFGTATVRVN